jgi:hypothetical protein
MITGHPLIDAGRAIAAVLNKCNSLEETNTAHLVSALEKLTADINPKKKELGPINKLGILPAFWQNNPLMGLNMSQLSQYNSKLKLLSNVDIKSRQGYCQVCASKGIFSDANRSWMPLAAGAEGDPCSLPGLRGKLLCADCFRSVVLLPLGCRFVKPVHFYFI